MSNDGARRAMSGSQLQVGVVTSRPLAVWQIACVEHLASVPGVRLVLWLDRAPSAADPPPAQAGPRSVGTVPDALRGMPPVGADALTSLSPRPGDDRPNVDVLVDLTAPGIGVPSWAGEIWRFGYGPALQRNAARAAIIDYIRGAGMTRVALVRQPDGPVIKEGRLQTLTWWRGELLDHLLIDVASWPAIAALERLDPNSDAQHGRPGAWGLAERRASSTPHAGVSMPVLVAGAAGRRIIAASRSMLRRPEWNIGIIEAPIERTLTPTTPPPITWLPTRPGHYAADPFAVERDGVLHILFEDFDHSLGIGSIYGRSIFGDGRVSEPRRAIETGVHASYPFLIEHEGSVFMLPETSASNELVLYEAERLPDRWRRVATLLSGIPAVDASVIHHEGRWWMFATRADHGDNHSLFIWHASELSGPWSPHLANPVKTDARSSRPAGTPFVVDGTLYRPSQDCSRVYGGRVVVNRVEVLTPRAFRERAVASMGPQPDSPYPDGLHTLSAAGRRTLVDGNAMHLVRGVLPRALGRGLRRAHMRLFGR